MIVVSNTDDGISIENGMFVTEIEGSNVHTGKKIRLRANESRVDIHYFIDPITHNKIIVQKRDGFNGEKYFFVEDQEEPSKNLLLKLEKSLISSPDS